MKTILMDVDGVLVSGRPQDGAHLFTDLERDLGIPLPLLQSTFFKPHWPDIVTGKKDLMPELAAVLAEIAPDVPAQALVDYWFRNDSRVQPDVLEAMDVLRQAGHAVYLATNQEHLRATYLMETIGLSRHVDGIFYSAAIGHRKPTPGFYEHVVTGLGQGPEDLVLIDDSEENVIAARSHGWHGVHFLPGTSVLAALGS